MVHETRGSEHQGVIDGQTIETLPGREEVEMIGSELTVAGEETDLGFCSQEVAGTTSSQ